MDWGGRSRGSGSPWSTILTTSGYGIVLPSGNKVQSVAPWIRMVVVAAVVLRGLQYSRHLGTGQSSHLVTRSRV